MTDLVCLVENTETVDDQSPKHRISKDEEPLSKYCKIFISFGR